MDADNTNNESSPHLESSNSNTNNYSNQINELTEEFDDLKATYQSMLIHRERKTIPILSKYERTRVVGERAIQISMGSPPLVEVGNLENPVDIAEKELREKKIPYIIKRVLPNGLIELWRVDELRID
jgi:DNA-directed RNA polymerase I, II, and III subunit RPABC2